MMRILCCHSAWPSQAFLRATWGNDLNVDKKLFRVLQIAASHLQAIRGDIGCKNLDDSYPALSVRISASIGMSGGDLEGGIVAASPAAAKKQCKSRLQMFEKQQIVFWPLRERFRLTGIRICQADGSSIAF